MKNRLGAMAAPFSPVGCSKTCGGKLCGPDSRSACTQMSGDKGQEIFPREPTKLSRDHLRASVMHDPARCDVVGDLNPLRCQSGPPFARLAATRSRDELRHGGPPLSHFSIRQYSPIF